MHRRRDTTLRSCRPDGDLDAMFRRYYARLREIAAGYFRDESGYRTLQPTAIVNEAYVRLSTDEELRWHSGPHFLSFAARVMRQVLVDAAREKSFKKRGGAATRVTLVDGSLLSLPRDPDVLDVERALERLEHRDPRKASLVQMRFFGGLTIDEAAEVLDVSVATANREWRAARAWLGRELEQAP
jgi:RNA polymerase sigma factor (TIGR02999 family)